MRNRIELSLSLICLPPDQWPSRLRQAFDAGIDCLHVDIADASCMSSQRCLPPEILAAVGKLWPGSVEVHLMVSGGVADYARFLPTDLGRLIYHPPKGRRYPELVEQAGAVARSRGAELFIGLDPDESKIEDLLDQDFVSGLTFLNVPSGAIGAALDPRGLRLMRAVRDSASRRRLKLQSDGAIELPVAVDAQASGASGLVLGTKFLGTCGDDIRGGVRNLWISLDDGRPAEVLTVDFAGLQRKLPWRSLPSGESIAFIDLAGDVALIDHAAVSISQVIPPNVDVIVSAEFGGALIGYSLSRLAGLPHVILRKKVRPTTGVGIRAAVCTIGTQHGQTLILSDLDTRLIERRRVILVDEVVSTGATMRAMGEICRAAGAEIVGRFALATEGDASHGVTALTHLPIKKGS